ncbi:MAG: PHP domain-containing protein [Bacilli bacterium]|nr:PHP domain-containing protein [Bacilli bacterium]
MNKITYCYHSHTKRCGHASGEDEEYVLKAIEFGLKDYGFSDHVILPNVIQEGMRGAYYLLDDYLNSVKKLKEKYKDKINIYTAFECEYMPQYEDYYRSLLKDKKVDYLILGQHCYFKGNEEIWYYQHGVTGLLEYTEHLIAGMKTGLFLYVAHPDFFMCTTGKWDNLTKECAQRIIDAAVKYDLPLEINLGHVRRYGLGEYAGLNSYYEYPFPPFWQMVAKSKAKVVIGFDSHRPIDVLHPGLEAVDIIVKESGVKPIYNLSLKDKKNRI